MIAETRTFGSTIARTPLLLAFLAHCVQFGHGQFHRAVVVESVVGVLCPDALEHIEAEMPAQSATGDVGHEVDARAELHRVARDGQVGLAAQVEERRRLRRQSSAGFAEVRATSLLVPVLAVFTNFAPGRLSIMFEFFLILSALLCFVGGPLRMLIAAIFEEGAAASQFVAQSSYVPAMPPAPARVTALPPASASPTSAWRPRPQTAEVAPPPSVTDHTTQLLNKSEPETE